MSLLYKSCDIFWFTFFHEAAHVLKHGKKRTFIEGLECSSEEEKQADRFAREMLIPPADYKLLTKETPTVQKIKVYARQLGISPGIIVGRLQHEGILPRNRLNSLKRSIVWTAVLP